MIDAPVSGGVPRARTGQLAIMVGGEDDVVAKVEAVLKPMGPSILRTGGVGSAHAMKALNNLVSAGGFLIGIEALLIGQRFGLDPALMVDVLNASTGMNNSTQKKFKQFVLSRSFGQRLRAGPDAEGRLDRPSALRAIPGRRCHSPGCAGSCRRPPRRCWGRARTIPSWRRYPSGWPATN